MDETGQTPEPTYQPPAVVPTPTYAPTPQSEPKKGKKTVGLLFVILAIILILGGVFYFLGKKGDNEITEASPTPTESLYDNNQPTAQASPSQSPEVEVDKAGVKILIQNGTGIAKEASYLSDKLKVLGYEDIDSGNADKQNYTATTVTFSSKLASSVVSELTKELEKVYQEVNTTKSSSLTVDVKIITGLRKGATAKPSSASTASPTATSTASSTPTSTPTATP